VGPQPVELIADPGSRYRDIEIAGPVEQRDCDHLGVDFSL
jgi:hypothetical protein